MAPLGFVQVELQTGFLCYGLVRKRKRGRKRSVMRFSVLRETMDWDGHFGLATARSRSLHRSASRPRSASPGRSTHYSGAASPTASSVARSRYADRAGTSYRQRPLYGTALAVGPYRGTEYPHNAHDGTYAVGAPQVVGYQEVPVYEQACTPRLLSPFMFLRSTHTPPRIESQTMSMYWSGGAPRGACPV